MYPAVACLQQLAVKAEPAHNKGQRVVSQTCLVLLQKLLGCYELLYEAAVPPMSASLRQG